MRTHAALAVALVLATLPAATNDPTYYPRPWTATPKLRLAPDTELFEFICNENERSTPHMGPHIK